MNADLRARSTFIRRPERAFATWSATEGPAHWAAVGAVSLGSLAPVLDLLAYGSDIASRL
jgi:hypothetical protein